MSTDYNLLISWQCLRRCAVNDLALSIFSTLPTNGRFSTLYLSLLSEDSLVSCDCACLMSTNKDETGRRLSRMLLFLVMWWSSLFNVINKEYCLNRLSLFQITSFLNLKFCYESNVLTIFFLIKRLFLIFSKNFSD